jgi:hypothetical protein
VWAALLDPRIAEAMAEWRDVDVAPQAPGQRHFVVKSGVCFTACLIYH